MPTFRAEGDANFPFQVNEDKHLLFPFRGCSLAFQWELVTHLEAGGSSRARSAVLPKPAGAMEIAMGLL